jgi:oligopeptide transport system permease protein
VRINVMLVKTQLFIEAAISIGASRGRIITKHILPNIMHIILVWMINTIPAVILLEAVLGYIGVPVTSATTDNDFTAISWGGLFFSGRSTLNSNPLVLIIPSVGILLISMSFLFLADFLKGVTREE